MFKFKHGFLFFSHNKQNSQFLPAMIRANKSTLDQIYRHPFNQKLFDGTLSSETFGRYLRDDYFYLHHFPLALKRLSAKTIKINPNLAELLQYMAEDIIGSELRMQQEYKEHLQEIGSFTPGPAISSYVAFLSEITALKEVSIGLSAVFPCFKVYHELGEMYKDLPDLHINPYKKWIQTYSSPDFILVTQQLSEAINLLGNKATPEIQAKMRKAFTSSAQHELAFFEEAYNPENKLQLIA